MTESDDERMPSIAEEPSEHLSSEVKNANIMINYTADKGAFCDVCAQMVTAIRAATGLGNIQIQQGYSGGHYVVPIKPANVVFVQSMGRQIFICLNHARELVTKFLSG